MADFVAIDVETANADMASICQIGMVRFQDGIEVDATKWLVDPQDHFDEINIAIHGIRPADVKGAPKLLDMMTDAHQRIADSLVVSHTHFDRVAIGQAHRCYDASPPSWRWLDSAMVARRTWPDVAKSGYGLRSLADRFGIKFQHHDALHDARTCGIVLLRALEHSGLGLSDWERRVRRPINPDSGKAIRRTGDGDGPLAGEIVVFTGSLSISRREAADLAHEHGAAVEPAVTKRTTLVVVGDHDVQRLGGHDKSAKHRRAESLIAEGHPIRILRETDFMAF